MCSWCKDQRTCKQNIIVLQKKRISHMHLHIFISTYFPSWWKYKENIYITMWYFVNVLTLHYIRFRLQKYYFPALSSGMHGLWKDINDCLCVGIIYFLSCVLTIVKNESFPLHIQYCSVDEPKDKRITEKPIFCGLCTTISTFVVLLLMMIKLYYCYAFLTIRLYFFVIILNAHASRFSLVQTHVISERDVLFIKTLRRDEMSGYLVYTYLILCFNAQKSI